MGARDTRKMASIIRAAARPAARHFHTSSVARASIPGDKAMTEHAIHATADWKKYSIWGMGAVGAVAVLEFFVHLSHSHHDEQIVYPFRKIRNKPFPWGDGQHSPSGARSMTNKRSVLFLGDTSRCVCTHGAWCGPLWLVGGVARFE